MACKEEREVSMAPYSRIGECPQHYLSVAICGGSHNWYVCEDCESKGFFIEHSGEPIFGFGPSPVLKNHKNDPELEGAAASLDRIDSKVEEAAASLDNLADRIEDLERRVKTLVQE